MNRQLNREECYLRNLDQINAIIDYVRLSGLNALNEYQKDKALNLTTRQSMLISTVARMTKQLGHGVPLSNIARELHMSVSSISHLVDSLEENNILLRRADTEDRRSVLITLSSNGQKYANLTRNGMLVAIEFLTSQLTEEENEQRVLTIEKIYRRAYPTAP